MDRRVDKGWPTRVAAKELPLEADPIVRFLNSGHHATVLPKGRRRASCGAYVGRKGRDFAGWLAGGDGLRQKQCYVIAVQSVFQSVFSLPPD